MAAYNAAATNIARKLNIALNDLFSVVTSKGRDNFLLPDGVHFKPEGYALLGRTVANCIKEAAKTAEQPLA